MERFQVAAGRAHDPVEIDKHRARRRPQWKMTEEKPQMALAQGGAGEDLALEVVAYTESKHASVLHGGADVLQFLI